MSTTLNINEIFGPTIQGEGIWAGEPCIFMRTVGCNLRCVFAGGSFCDTPYTSHNPEPPAFTTVADALREVSRLFDENPNVRHLIITGGEPMLQQRGISAFIDQFRMDYPDVYITMETNGTVENMSNVSVDLASFSPKLKTSGCFEGTDVPEKLREMHHKNRINYKAINSLNADMKQLKFVYSDENSGKDIDEWLDGFEKAGGFIGTYDILIMPEGLNESQLKESSQKAVDYCISRGYRFCDRLHIRIWGPKRGV